MKKKSFIGFVLFLGVSFLNQAFALPIANEVQLYLELDHLIITEIPANHAAAYAKERIIKTTVPKVVPDKTKTEFHDADFTFVINRFAIEALSQWLDTPGSMVKVAIITSYPEKNAKELLQQIKLKSGVTLDKKINQLIADERFTPANGTYNPSAYFVRHVDLEFKNQFDLTPALGTKGSRLIVLSTPMHPTTEVAPAIADEVWMVGHPYWSFKDAAEARRKYATLSSKTYIPADDQAWLMSEEKMAWIFLRIKEAITKNSKDVPQAIRANLKEPNENLHREGSQRLLGVYQESTVLPVIRREAKVPYVEYCKVVRTRDLNEIGTLPTAECLPKLEVVGFWENVSKTKCAFFLKDELVRVAPAPSKSCGVQAAIYFETIQKLTVFDVLPEFAELSEGDLLLRLHLAGEINVLLYRDLIMAGGSSGFLAGLGAACVSALADYFKSHPKPIVLPSVLSVAHTMKDWNVIKSNVPFTNYQGYHYTDDTFFTEWFKMAIYDRKKAHIACREDKSYEKIFAYFKPQPNYFYVAGNSTSSRGYGANRVTFQFDENTLVIQTSEIPAGKMTEEFAKGYPNLSRACTYTSFLQLLLIEESGVDLMYYGYSNPWFQLMNSRPIRSAKFELSP